MRRRERVLGPSKTGNTRGPLRLTSTNWLATPAHLILLRFSHRCPLPLPHNVRKKLVEMANDYQSYIKDAYTNFFFFLMCFGFVCVRQTAWLLSAWFSVSQVWPYHLFTSAHTHVQPLSAKMYNSAEYSLIFLFFCTMYEFMEICAHGANSIVGTNLSESK